MCSRPFTDDELAALTPHARDIAMQGGCPRVNYDAPALRYADIFPGRVWTPRVAADMAPDYARGLAA